MRHDIELKQKFKSFKRRMKLPLWQAKGILQSIWDFTTTNAMNGDIGKFSNQNIADAIEYDDDPDFLMDTLYQEGWLDCEDGVFWVHDWYENCPEFVRKRIQRKLPTPKNIGEVEQMADNGGQQQPTAENGSIRKKEREESEASPDGDAPPPSGKKKPGRKKITEYPPIPASLDSKEFREAWEKWNKFRQEKNGKLTPSTVDYQFKLLVKHGIKAAIWSISESITRGWTGLFPEKYEGPTTFQDMFTQEQEKPSGQRELSQEEHELACYNSAREMGKLPPFKTYQELMDYKNGAIVP